MAESDELFNEVAQLRDEVEEQGAMIDALVHINGSDLRTEILADMAKDDALREVYDTSSTGGGRRAKSLPISPPAGGRAEVRRLVEVRQAREGLQPHPARTPRKGRKDLTAGDPSRYDA